jgi:hypothetical protein
MVLPNNERFEDYFSDKNSVAKELGKEIKKFDDLQEILSKERRILVEIQTSFSDEIKGQVLVNCDPTNNHDFLIGLSKHIINNGEIPLIILTSTNYKSLLNLFKISKVPFQKVFIVDTITRNVFFINDFERVFFVDSLRNLTQLQIKLFKIVSQNKVVFIFDSINVLELYHSEKIIFKFIYSLTRLMHKFKTNGFYIVNKKNLVQKIGQFCDNIVELPKVE